MTAGQPSDYVLIVEDDADIVEMVEMILQASGYAPVVARDGAEALRRLRAGPLPRVVLLDMMMPIMDGKQFRDEQLRDPAIAEVPVVVMSGDAHVDERMAELRVAKWLRKPLDIDDLLAAVREPR